MKIATLAFLLLLGYAHLTGDTERLLAQPLSMFRDGQQSAAGYGLFALLGLVAAAMTAACVRAGRDVEVCVLCVAGFLLVIVAVTPSLWPLHELCSLLLLSLLYWYFALLFYAWESRWRWLLFVHLPAPLALVIVTQCHSYGLWQKSLIVYFVVVINIHYHLVVRYLPRLARLRKSARGRNDPLGKRRVVYILTPGKPWRRRAPARTRLSTTV